MSTFWETDNADVEYIQSKNATYRGKSVFPSGHYLLVPPRLIGRPF